LPPAPANKPQTDVAAWHPRLRRLHAYWISIRPAGRKLPGRQHFDPCDIPELLSFMTLIDVQREPFRLKYRLVGTRIVDVQRADHTGRWLDEAFPHLLQDPEYLARFRDVLETGLPNRRVGPAVMMLNEIKTIENVIFPLADDGENPNMMIGYSVMYDLSGRDIAV
jgi:hypothetical protein